MGNEEPAKRFFRVDQANRMLPLVAAIVGDIVAQYRDLCERRDRLAVIQQRGGESRGPYREEVEQIEEQLNHDAARLQELLEELRPLGVEFKDFTLGLIDFPTLIDGREAYLCWKLGEPEVIFWHDLDAGFRGRQPLTADLASGSAESVAEP